MLQTKNKSEFLQINLHKAIAPTAELNYQLKDKCSFIALIQEPLFRNGKVQGLNRKNGDHIIHSAGTGSPRACIYFF